MQTKFNHKLNDFLFLSNSVIPPKSCNASTSNVIIHQIADTGASYHYAGVNSSINISPTSNGIKVLLPNGHTMVSTYTKQLDIPSLPTSACTQHLFPEMKTTGLLSIGKLCDHDCTAMFTRRQLIVRNKHGDIILIGQRDPHLTNGMWIFDVKDHRPQRNMLHTCNAVILAETTKKDLAQFHHASLGFPVKSTLLKAIDSGFLSSFPGLDKNLIKRHLPKSVTTHAGTWTKNEKTSNRQNKNNLQVRITFPMHLLLLNAQTSTCVQ